MTPRALKSSALVDVLRPVLEEEDQLLAGAPHAGQIAFFDGERPVAFIVGAGDPLDAHLVWLRNVKEAALAGEHQRRSDGEGFEHQWATAAAAASSISRPVRKRSSVNGALIGCGLSLAMVCAKTWPEPGVALKPPVPQPQLT